MVVEDVLIKVSERGSRATARGIRQVGQSSRRAKIAVASLITALGGFLTVRGLARVAADAVQASAAFEQYGIQIAALLGSQKEANIALENFVDLAAKTPFAVSQVIQGATALGAAAVGNREKLERLTQTAANLAAVTGLTFTQAASNLQRALGSAGIAAADLFREKGVTGLLQSILGITDITKLTMEETDAAFQKVFGKEGTFGTAAEDLSNTLGGALSNIGDAAERTSIALGDAFAPSVINAARQAIIPFLDELRLIIEDNEVEIREFAAGVIKFLIPALANLTRVGFAVAQTFLQVKEFTNTLIGAFADLNLSVQESQLALLQEQAAEGSEVAAGKIEAQQALVLKLRGGVDRLASALREETDANEKFVAGIEAANLKLAELEGLIEGVDFSRVVRPVRPDIDLTPPEGSDSETATEATARIAAEKKVLQITSAIRVQSAARVSALDAQLERLTQQAEKLREAAAAAGDEASALEGLAGIEAQRLSIQQEQSDLRKEEAAEIAKLRQEAAQEIGGQILQGIRTDGQSLLDDLAAFGEEKFAEAFGEAILSLGDALTDVLEEAFGDIDFGAIFGDQSGAIGSAFGAALGVGASILAKELEGNSSKSRNDLVKSAVQDAQATRGVVAGPTSIPVFQVGQQIEEALGGTEDLLTQILGAIRAQPVGGAGAGAASSGASGELSSTTADLS